MALTQNKPVLKENNTVLVFLENSVQKDLVRENSTRILSLLHRALDNYHIRIKTEIRQQDKKQKAYLPKDKLKELIKKNPHIRTLKDELDLDLDYN